MRLRKSLVGFLSLLIFISIVSSLTAEDVPYPTEFEGSVTINGEQPNDREVFVYVGGNRQDNFMADGSGYNVLVSGQEGEQVVFKIEDVDGELVDSGESWNITEFGEIKEVDLSFNIIKPDPTVSGSVLEKGESFAVVETGFNFADEGSDVYVEYNDSETEVEETSGEDVVFNLTGLGYDSRYEYQVFLDNGTEVFNNSVDSFETENLDGLTVQGSTNLNSSERVVASIGVDTVYNDTLDSDGDFFFTTRHNDSYFSSNVSIDILDKTKEFEYSPDTTLRPNFTFEGVETETEEDGENESDNETGSEDPGSLESEVMSDDDEDDSGSETSNDDSTSSDENVDSRNETLNSSETESEDEENSSDNSLTGDFISSQTNNTSLFLIVLITVLGGYLLLEVI